MSEKPGCKICGRKIESKKLCGRHYYRLTKYGDPLHPVRYRPVDDEPKRPADRGIARAALYGLTPEEVDQIWNSQSGRCGICADPLQKTGSASFNIDHCHETSKVRGLLCRRCNYGLGMMGDSETRLRAAIGYITREALWGSGVVVTRERSRGRRHRSVSAGDLMTAFPTDENHGHWWLTTWARYGRLHAVPGGALTQEDLGDVMDRDEAVQRRTACGQELELTYAGVTSQSAMPRCGHCCHALGLPPGDGSPCNEQSEAKARVRRAAEVDDPKSSQVNGT